MKDPAQNHSANSQTPDPQKLCEQSQMFIADKFAISDKFELNCYTVVDNKYTSHWMKPSWK